MIMKKRIKIAINNPIWDYVILKYLLAPRLLKKIADDRPLRVLEVGCGRGGSTNLLLKYLPMSGIVATDIDPEQVEAARRRNTSGQISYGWADHCQLPFSDNDFDLLVEFNVLHHVLDWKKAIDEAWRVLKPGGRWVIAGITKEGLRDSLFRLFVDPKSLFSAKEFVEAAEHAGFTVKEDLGNGFFMRYILTKNENRTDTEIEESGLGRNLSPGLKAVIKSIKYLPGALK